MTDPVPSEAGVVVRRIADRLETEPAAQGPGLRSPEAEERMTVSDPHAGQTVEAGAAQEVQEDGLGLVVHGVPGGRLRPHGGTAGLAGPGLKIGPGRHHEP